MEQIIIIRTKYETVTFLNPWGKPATDTAESIVDEVIVTPTGDTHSYGNRYQDLEGEVYVDVLTGERYHRYLTVDYSNNVHYRWLPLSERDGFYRTPSINGQYLRDGVPTRWNGVEWYVKETP